MRIAQEVVPFEGSRIPVLTAMPDSGTAERGHRILMLYGGSTKEEQRKKVISFWGPVLTDCGFILHTFEYRSNLDERRFRNFGLYDRLQDARMVFRWLRSAGSLGGKRQHFYEAPLSVMGVSMGGYLAVRLAAGNPYLVRALILVAPAAYHDQACQRSVKFGRDFSQAIRYPPKGWRERCSAFDEARTITADCLTFAYEHDEVVPREIPETYDRNMHALRNEVHRAYDGEEYIRQLKILKGFKHRGSFDNPEKRSEIMRSLCHFFKEIS